MRKQAALVTLAAALAFSGCSGGGDPVAMCETLGLDCTGIGGRDASPPSTPAYDPREFQLTISHLNSVAGRKPQPAQGITQVPCFIT